MYGHEKDCDCAVCEDVQIRDRKAGVIMACEKHRKNSARGYYQCPGCEIEHLRTLLAEAKEIVKIFHGPSGWEIYERNAPEMKRINAAFFK